MRISVIIPAYNCEKTIIATLDSIKNQTSFHQIFEIIIINDGSTDDTLDVINKYKYNNKEMPIMIINKSNGGVSSARNMGMDKANGDWIAFCDSDDEWVHEKLKMQIEMIIKYPEIDFIGGDINDKGLKILFKKVNTLYKANIMDLCFKMFPQTSTALFKKTIYDTIGGFDEKQYYAEDGNYFFKICTHYNYYHLPVRMVKYGLGKRAFGVSGLSANLSGMYRGYIKNIKELKNERIISNKTYIFLRIFYWIKYLRRILITELTKLI